MGKDSSIQWTTHTFNPWRGCTKISPGCANCYAEGWSIRIPRIYGKWGPLGSRVVASEAKWREPLAWDRAAAKAGERHRVFCASLADVFEDWSGPMVDSTGLTLHVTASGEWKPGPLRDGRECGFVPVTMNSVRERLFDLIDHTPNLDYLLLTKRPERWRRCWPLVPVPGHVRQNEGDGKTWQKFPNLWAGTSVENVATKSRIDMLREIPATVRFLSMEPLIEDPGILDLRGIHWVIVGGESGPKARSFRMSWVRSIIEQCKLAGVPCFVKQLGADPIEDEPDDGPEWPVVLEHDNRGNIVPVLRDSHGGDWEEWSEDLRVREFPGVTR